MSHITTEENSGTRPRENLRIRAEKFLTAEGGEFDKISPADVKNLVLDLKMYQMQLEMQNEELQRTEAELQHSLEKLTKALDGTVLAVANTVEMRDPYTGGHQRQVAQLACAIAQEMGFSPERVEAMRVLECLHDIGKIAIPAEILSKPGRLSEMEFTLIQDHPRVGYEII